jgi:hypothetical protein
MAPKRHPNDAERHPNGTKYYKIEPKWHPKCTESKAQESRGEQMEEAGKGVRPYTVHLRRLHPGGRTLDPGESLGPKVR